MSRRFKSGRLVFLLGALVGGFIAESSRGDGSGEVSEPAGPRAAIRPCSIPESVSPGPDFMTCGCINGAILEFCSGPCDDVAVLCEDYCRMCGGGTALFTACMPGGCA